VCVCACVCVRACAHAHVCVCVCVCVCVHACVFPVALNRRGALNLHYSDNIHFTSTQRDWMWKNSVEHATNWTGCILVATDREAWRFS